MLPTFQTESVKKFVIRALADTVLEGDEHFTVQLFPAESGAVIDPLHGWSPLIDSDLGGRGCCR